MYRLIGFKLNVIKPLITATINETFQYPNNNQDIIKAIVAIPREINIQLFFLLIFEEVGVLLTFVQCYSQ